MTAVEGLGLLCGELYANLTAANQRIAELEAADADRVSAVRPSVGGNGSGDPSEAVVDVPPLQDPGHPDRNANRMTDGQEAATLDADA